MQTRRHALLAPAGAPAGPPAGYTGITALGNYEETDTAHIQRGTTTWDVGAGAVHSSGACIYIGVAGVSLTVPFWLTVPCRLQFTSITDPTLAQFLLRLDGTTYGTINQNGAGGANAHVIYTSGIIPAGSHTLIATTDNALGGMNYIWDLLSFIPA